MPSRPIIKQYCPHCHIRLLRSALGDHIRENHENERALGQKRGLRDKAGKKTGAAVIKRLLRGKETTFSGSKWRLWLADSQCRGRAMFGGIKPARPSVVSGGLPGLGKRN